MRLPAYTVTSCISLRTLNYGNCGIFLLMGDAGFISSTVWFTRKGKTLNYPKPKSQNPIPLIWPWASGLR